MAIQAYVALSAADGFFKRPIDNHGKLRTVYNKFVTAVVGDIGSTFAMGKLPPGAVRVLYPFCFVKTSALGAGVTLSIGHAAYRSKQDQNTLNDGIEPASVNAFASALDMSAAARLSFSATLLKFDLYSLAGVDVIATSAGAVVPAAATIETLMTYIYE